MKALAKAGFNQSYTYFTWRNSKQELIDYFTELTQTEMSEYFRPNLWPNTPDILAVCASRGRSPCVHDSGAHGCDAFAAFTEFTADTSCARTTRCPGREEYLDSEKYQFKKRDWNAPGNIKDWIARINQIRKQNRALQMFTNLRFYPADNDAILFYGKMTPARDNIILVVVNLDPFRKQNSFDPCADRGIRADGKRRVSGARFVRRFALHLARSAQLRRARSGNSTGTHFSRPPPVTSSQRSQL